MAVISHTTNCHIYHHMLQLVFGLHFRSIGNMLGTQDTLKYIYQIWRKRGLRGTMAGLQDDVGSKWGKPSVSTPGQNWSLQMNQLKMCTGNSWIFFPLFNTIKSRPEVARFFLCVDILYNPPLYDPGGRPRVPKVRSYERRGESPS